MTNKPILICVVGPTAIGKTALAIEIAKHFSTEIISADSRQFYKEMKIGTAVPSKEELAAAPHHFIQNRSIFEEYSVGDYEEEAIKLLESLFKIHPIIVMVGGSGLYVDAVVKGLNKFPDIPNNIREQLNNEFKSLGLISLQKELKEKDPEYYHKVDINNPHRIIRALEVCRVSNRSYSSFLNIEKVPRDFNAIYIGLQAEREIVYERINKRVDIMFAEGLEEEAKKLYFHKDLNALQTVGYKEIFEYLDGTYSKDTAIAEIKKNTRRFAKRQGTWFNKNKEITWFNFPINTKDVFNYIHNALDESKAL